MPEKFKQTRPRCVRISRDPPEAAAGVAFRTIREETAGVAFRTIREEAAGLKRV